MKKWILIQFATRSRWKCGCHPKPTRVWWILKNVLQIKWFKALFALFIFPGSSYSFSLNIEQWASIHISRLYFSIFIFKCNFRVQIRCAFFILFPLPMKSNLRFYQRQQKHAVDWTHIFFLSFYFQYKMHSKFLLQIDSNSKKKLCQ